MSIYVSISRRSYPFQDGAPAISASEWLRVADDEPDFRLPMGEEAEWVGPHARVWTGYHRPVVFDFTSLGEIDVKSPSPPVIARMKQLAARLNANVFAAETGEIFDDDGNTAGFVDEVD